MKFIKRIETLLTEIAFQLKRNANEAEKQNEYINRLGESGLYTLKFDKNRSICTVVDDLDNKISIRPTENKTQEMIEREIEYQNRLKEIQEKYPEMLEFITTISTNYANLDKHGILDAVKVFSNEYVVGRK